MSKNLKKAMIGVMAPLMAAAAATGTSLYDYGFGTRHPRATTAEENSFVEKQGYKESGKRDKAQRAEQYRRKLKRKNKSYKGHKHGGARK